MTDPLKAEARMGPQTHLLPVRSAVLSQACPAELPKHFENFQGLAPTQTKWKKNAGSGAGHIFKFSKVVWVYSLNLKNRAWEEIQTSSRWRYIAYRFLFCTLSQRILNNSMRLDGLMPLFLFYRWGNRFWEVRWCAQGPTGDSGLQSPSPAFSFSPPHRAASQLGKTSQKNQIPL